MAGSWSLTRHGALNVFGSGSTRRQAPLFRGFRGNALDAKTHFINKPRAKQRDARGFFFQ